MTKPAQYRTPAEQLRHIADEKLVKASAAWSDLHRISGYIEALEEANARVSMQLQRAEALLTELQERGECP